MIAYKRFFRNKRFKCIITGNRKDNLFECDGWFLFGIIPLYTRYRVIRPHPKL